MLYFPWVPNGLYSSTYIRNVVGQNIGTKNHRDRHMYAHRYKVLFFRSIVYRDSSSSNIVIELVLKFIAQFFVFEHQNEKDLNCARNVDKQLFGFFILVGCRYVNKILDSIRHGKLHTCGIFFTCKHHETTSVFT